MAATRHRGAMIHAARTRRPVPPLAVLFLVAAAAGCASDPPPPAPGPATGASRYTCPDGRSFTTQFNATTHQTNLWLTGAGLHRLNPVPDPNGGTLSQDSAFQLRPGPTDAAMALTDRATTFRQTCPRDR